MLKKLEEIEKKVKSMTPEELKKVIDSLKEEIDKLNKEAIEKLNSELEQNRKDHANPDIRSGAANWLEARRDNDKSRAEIK